MAESEEQPRPSRRSTRRGFFVRGLVVVLPAVLTIFLFVTVVQFAERYVAGPINRVIYASLDGNALGWRALRSMGVDPYDPRFLLAEDAQPDDVRTLYTRYGDPKRAEFLAELDDLREGKATFMRDHDTLGIDASKLREAVRAKVGIWAGILLAAGIVLTAGYLASGFLGRSAIRGVDRALARLPVVRAVYPHAKQLVEFFLADNEFEFDTVVAAPYPSAGVWSIGFVTGAGLRSINAALKGSYVAVYIPSSPVPMTGYVAFLDADGLVPLDISVEEAFRTVVSCGVLVPESERVEGGEEALKRLGVPSRRAERKTDARAENRGEA